MKSVSSSMFALPPLPPVRLVFAVSGCIVWSLLSKTAQALSTATNQNSSSSTGTFAPSSATINPAGYAAGAGLLLASALAFWCMFRSVKAAGGIVPEPRAELHVELLRRV